MNDEFFGPLAESMGQREIEVALLLARDLIDRFRLTTMPLRVAIND